MKKKLKIAMYVSSNASQAGGDKEHILNLSTYLNDKGHKVDIYGPINNIYPFKNYFPITESIFLPGKNNVAVNIPLRESKEIIHKINLRKYDIIHIHDVFFWYLPLRLLYPRKKVFITFHGYETQFPPSRSAIWQRRLAAKLTSGNICVGDYIGKWYGIKPTLVTYGATDLGQRSIGHWPRLGRSS